MTGDSVNACTATSHSFLPELKLPNEQTRAALKEAQEIRKRRTARFETPDATLADLNDPVDLAADRR